MDAARTARAAWARRGADRLPPHARADAGARLRGGRGGARGGRADQLAADDQGVRRRRRCTVEVMELDDDRLPAADRRVRDAGGRHRSILALGQETRHGVPARACRASSSRPTARCVVGADMMTGLPGRVRRRRHGAVRAHRHGRRRPRQEGRAPHRRLAARQPAYDAAPKHELATFDKLHLWYFGDAAAARAARTRRSSGASQTFDEVVGGLDATRRRSYEARRCLSCGNCFECDGCFGACPEDAVDQARARASATSSTTTTAPAAPSASSSARAHAIDMVPDTAE